LHKSVRRNLTPSLRLGSCALACVLAGVLAMLPLADAHAQRPRNGEIAFSAKRGGARVIYARRPDGTRLHLVHTGGRSDQPAFSPGGKRLLFTRYGSGGAQVWTTYLDGTGLRLLTTGGSDGMAQWSPTGEEVVFARGRRGRRHLYTVVADGTGGGQLTFGGDDSWPTWSVKDRIAFVRTRRRTSRIYSITPSGGSARRVTRGKANDTYPDWSPTGRTLAVARGAPGHRDLYLLRADGSRARRLTALPGDETSPAWSPDGTRIAFTYQLGRRRWLYLMKVRGGALRQVRSRSARVRRLSSSRSAASQPSWQPTGLDPVVAAAGDIACDPQNPYFNAGLGIPGVCRQKLTSDLLLRMDLSNILALGDDQYEDGQLSKFQRSFDPSWGRLKPLIRSVPGNHEYDDPAGNASGYFDYFNGPGTQSGPVGDRDKGYYSFDIGSWHVVALNSECRHIGGCGASSPQISWLRTDLAAHPTACTLAFWHRPTFTSGGHSDQGDMRPAWDALYSAGADVILTGHDHLYERFAPQTPGGVLDPAHGIREFIAGIGGKSRFGFPEIQPNSQVRISGVLGVLELTLGRGSYEWSVRAAPTGRVADSGSEACH
jgi:Tol biopolymer transport system component